MSVKKCGGLSADISRCQHENVQVPTGNHVTVTLAQISDVFSDTLMDLEKTTRFLMWAEEELNVEINFFFHGSSGNNKELSPKNSSALFKKSIVIGQRNEDF